MGDIVAKEIRGELPGQRPVEVIAALEKLGPEAVSAVPELVAAIDAVHPPECNFRECIGTDLVPPILRTLKAIGPGAAALSVPRLTKLLVEKQNQYPVEYVFEALTAFGPQSRPALAVVTDYLTTQPMNSGHRGPAIGLIALDEKKSYCSVFLFSSLQISSLGSAQTS